MIFRIQIDGLAPEDGHVMALLYATTGEMPAESSQGKGVLTGLMGNPRLNRLMNDLGLPTPQITNPKARFYFTDAGWRKFGRVLFSEARQLGHVMKVISRKDPLASQVVYEDKYQVAILPLRVKRPQREKHHD